MKKNLLAIIIMFGVGMVSCTNKKDDINPQPANASLTFNLMHFVGSDEVDFNTIKYTNAFGNIYSVETLKYFISDITLFQSDGSSVLIDEEFYVDAMDETTLTFSTKSKVPTGDYTLISFIFGLNAEKNVSGMFPNPPESNMEWPMAMGPGYHYMKLEGKLDSAGVTKNYQAHTGATNGNQNFIKVDLANSGFIVTGSGATISLKMNINNWWVSPNTLDLNTMTMIMGNQQMQVKLHDNGKEDVFSVFSIE